MSAMTSSTTNKVDDVGFIESDCPLEGFDWAVTILIEVANIGSLLARPCAGEYRYNLLVNHYISWQLIFDVVAVFFLPPKRRHWTSPFRMLQSLVLLYITVALRVENLEEAGLAFQLRLMVCLVRLAHASSLLFKYKTTAAQIWALPGSMRTIININNGGFRFHLTHSVVYGSIIMGLGNVLFPHLMYLTHYNFGVPTLDAVMTSIQAANGVCEMMKKLVYLILIPSSLDRAVAAWFVFVVFAIQWVVMFPAFRLAPLPYAHLGAEIAFLADAVLLTREWWHHHQGQTKLKDSNHGFEQVVMPLATNEDS